MSTGSDGGRRVVLVHRAGAVVVAVVIAAFGVLGLVGGLSFFDTGGAPVLGLSTNGALSTVSLVTAVVLVAAAIRGGRLASTVMIVVGTLFLVSAFANLWLIGTSANVLAFRLPNVFRDRPPAHPRGAARGLDAPQHRRRRRPRAVRAARRGLNPGPGASRLIHVEA